LTPTINQELIVRSAPSAPAASRIAPGPSSAATLTRAYYRRTRAERDSIFVPLYPLARWALNQAYVGEAVAVDVPSQLPTTSAAVLA
jgi:hypothetical protein